MHSCAYAVRFPPPPPAHAVALHAHNASVCHHRQHRIALCMHDGIDTPARIQPAAAFLCDMQMERSCFRISVSICFYLPEHAYFRNTDGIHVKRQLGGRVHKQ